MTDESPPSGRKTIGYVELEWKCPSCGTRNRGSRRTCAQCGAPQPRDVKFEQAPQEQIITDQQVVAAAEAGPDIHCGYCGARNPATAKTCKQCGGDLAEGARRAAGEVVGALRTEEAPPIRCPSCGTANPATALKCSQCGSPLSKPEPTPMAAPRPAGCSRGLLLIGLAAVAILALFIFLSTRTQDLVGQVSEVRWRRVIALEALQPVMEEGWRSDIPAGARIGNCVQRPHHLQDQPAPGAREVCGTPYVIDQGSGYGKVVQDCQYQVYADWCQYEALAWVPMAPLVLEASDLNPRWPTVSLRQGERVGEATEVYRVILVAEDRTFTYRPETEEEYRQFVPGSRWVLKVNTFGGITEIYPAR